MNKPIRIIRRVLFLAGCFLASQLSADTGAEPVAATMSAPATVIVEQAPEKSSTSTADHSKFDALKKDFKSGPEVTKACLTCHTEAAKQVHNTKHWTWEFLNPATEQRLGKKNVINNFCTSVTSNQTFCSACHVGYGWADDKFDFTSENNVDCVVCHDTTGKYKKLPGLSGHPNYYLMEWPPHSGKFREPTDLKTIAQKVGKTYNKFAQWLALPQVPDLFLGD